MVDIDDILAAAIRTVWLHAGGAASQPGYHLEIERARRVRAALECEGVVITRAGLMPEVSAAASPHTDPSPSCDGIIYAASITPLGCG
ncbi:MAG: hypothetical protein ACREC0_06410 [Methylocella sp.]